MAFFSSRLPALAAGLILLAGPVSSPFAQAPPSPPAPPHPAKMDPQAKIALNQMTAAYKALQSYSATITEETDTGVNVEKHTVSFSFRRPNHARVSIGDASGILEEIVSDGKKLTVSIPSKKQYMEQALPTGEPVVSVVLSQARGLLLPTLAADPEFLSGFLAQPGVVVEMGPPATVAGAATESVIATLSAQHDQKIKFTFLLGSADHLLQRLTETAQMTQEGKSATLSHVETVKTQTPDAALTASDFIFVPPPGTKKIADVEPPEYDTRLKPGAKPFVIAAKDLAGKPLSLAQYKGKVVLLDFWATWCGPCVGEMPNVIAAYHKYHAQGFDIVGISLDQDKSALTAFLKRNKIPWRQVYDGKGWGSAVPRRYGVAAIPFGLLLNRNGTIAAVSVRGEALAPAIQRALAEK